MPALMNAAPGTDSTIETIGDPQFLQKRRRTAPPVAPVSRYSERDPASVIDSDSSGTATIIENAVPVCFWQFGQWHIAVMLGSAEHRYVTFPHRHDPFNSGTTYSCLRAVEEPPLTVLGKRQPPYREMSGGISGPVAHGCKSIRESPMTTFPMDNVLLAFSRQQHTELTDRLPDRNSKDDSCYFVSSIFHSRFSLHSETSSNSSSRSLPAGLSKASFVAAQVVKFG